MRDKGTIDLEAIYEKRILFAERNFDLGTIVSSKLAGASVEKIITNIVNLIDLEVPVANELINKVKSENKIGELIQAIHDAGLKVPFEVAHAIHSDEDEFGGDAGELGDDEDDDVGSGAPEPVKELDFNKPRFGEIPDEEDDGGEQGSISLDPGMR